MTNSTLRTSREAGLSLIEATVILMVLAIMTSVLAPTTLGYLDDARYFKAKEDCEAIGVSLTRLLWDTGGPFLLRDGDLPMNVRYLENNRVDLLVSTGDTPGVHSGTIDGPTLTYNRNIQNAVLWSDPLSDLEVDSMHDHLVSNEVGYLQPTTPFDTNDPVPPYARGMFRRGWRGAYVSPIIGPDPWGYRYAVNSVYLGTAIDSDFPTEGQHGRGWSFDTLCVSAGADNFIATNFEDTLAASGGGMNRNGGTSWDEAYPALQGSFITSQVAGSGHSGASHRSGHRSGSRHGNTATRTDLRGGRGGAAAGDDVVYVLSGFGQ